MGVVSRGRAPTGGQASTTQLAGVFGQRRRRHRSLVRRDDSSTWLTDGAARDCRPSRRPEWRRRSTCRRPDAQVGGLHAPSVQPGSMLDDQLGVGLACSPLTRERLLRRSTCAGDDLQGDVRRAGSAARVTTSVGTAAHGARAARACMTPSATWTRRAGDGGASRNRPLVDAVAGPSPIAAGWQQVEDRPGAELSRPDGLAGSTRRTRSSFPLRGARWGSPVTRRRTTVRSRLRLGRVRSRGFEPSLPGRRSSSQDRLAAPPRSTPGPGPMTLHHGDRSPTSGTSTATTALSAGTADHGWRGAPAHGVPRLRPEPLARRSTSDVVAPATCDATPALSHRRRQPLHPLVDAADGFLAQHRPLRWSWLEVHPVHRVVASAAGTSAEADRAASRGRCGGAPSPRRPRRSPITRSTRPRAPSSFVTALGAGDVMVREVEAGDRGGRSGCGRASPVPVDEADFLITRSSSRSTMVRSPVRTARRPRSHRSSTCSMDGVQLDVGI